jgi:hypothetical protein
MPLDKAPGPDGFTGAFFKSCWEIIKDDIMAVVNSLFAMNSQGFQLLNSANIVLLPKKMTPLESQIIGPSASSIASPRYFPNF